LGVLVWPVLTCGMCMCVCVCRWPRTTHRPRSVYSSVGPRPCLPPFTSAAIRARPHAAAVPSSSITRKTFDDAQTRAIGQARGGLGAGQGARGGRGACENDEREHRARHRGGVRAGHARRTMCLSVRLCARGKCTIASASFCVAMCALPGRERERERQSRGCCPHDHLRLSVFCFSPCCTILSSTGRPCGSRSHTHTPISHRHRHTHIHAQTEALARTEILTHSHTHAQRDVTLRLRTATMYLRATFSRSALSPSSSRSSSVVGTQKGSCTNTRHPRNTSCGDARPDVRLRISAQ
jgi:hypothetical protein